MPFKTRDLILSALVAAMYVALCALLQPFSFGFWQLRVSEALCIMPFFFPTSAFGLFAGCLLSNFLLGGLGVPDIVLGSLATLSAALLTARIKIKWLVPVPAIVINALVVPVILLYAGIERFYLLGVLSVGLGQLAACAGLGLPLLLAMERVPFIRKWRYEG